MRRISADAAGVALDLHGSGKHGFTDGDIDNGIAATVPGAEPLNFFQEEIMSVLEGEGVAESDNTDDLYTAIKACIQRLAGNAVSQVVWFPCREVIAAGYIAADGQEVLRSSAPALVARLDDLPTVSDATWVADKTKRASYSLGDGSTTFRYPDYNGTYSGDVRLFLSGDGANAAGYGVVQKASLLTGDDDGNDTVNSASKIESEREDWGWDPADLSLYSGAQSNAVPRGGAGDVDATHTGAARPANVAGCWAIFIGQ